MTKAYQYDASGYFAGAIDDCGLLPNNATYTKPTTKAGFIPCWNGTRWDSVEDHTGKKDILTGSLIQ